MGVDGLHLAEAAEAQKLVADDEVGLAQALHSGLIDAVVLGGRGHDGLAFAHGHGGGLLGVDVLAGLHGGDRYACVPAVACGGVDDVDVGAGEKLAHVDVRLAVLVAVVLVHDILHRVAAHLPHVADGDELHVLLGQHPAAHHSLAASAQSDASHDDAVGRRHCAVAPQCRCWHQPRHCRGSSRARDERTARHPHANH